MSVIIKGMEMPKSCTECKFFIEDSWCSIRKGGPAVWFCKDERSVNCPLVEAPKWIPVTERLPEEYEYVLCRTDYGMEVGYHRNEWGQDEWTTGELGSGTIDVSHWMPLPQPPKDGEP